MQKYIRNIASEEKEKKTFVNHNIEPKKGNTTIHFNRSMEIPKTTAYVHLTGAVKYWQQTAYEMYMIGELLSKRFLQTIREEEGESYGVQINGSLQKLPSSRFDIVLNFDCKPEKKEKLIEIVWKELNQLKNNPPVGGDLDDIKKDMLKQREESKMTNSFWNSVLSAIYLWDNQYLNEGDYENLTYEELPNSNQ
ncbi:insulinase family protein [Flavobacterium sp. ST-87]|uniref:Insulinase family protein n=1 Tax=Flavobacterium plantiphilum TaxID=3163297 RepID=A0ABW8XVJ9_9FLAO